MTLIRQAYDSATDDFEINAVDDELLKGPEKIYCSRQNADVLILVLTHLEQLLALVDAAKGAVETFTSQKKQSDILKAMLKVDKAVKALEGK